MATRQSAPGAPVNDRVRMNMQQVREQQELNRERKAQLESVAERNAAAREKTKSQYAHVSSRVSAATAAAIASGPAAGSGRGAAAALRGLQGAKPPTQQQQPPEDDVKITVFVRECDPDGGVFSIFESEVIKQQQAALAQAAAGGAATTGAAGGSSTARGGTAAARTTAARAPSNAPPTGGRPAPAAAFGRAAVATTSRAAPAPGAPTTPLQPLPHNSGNAAGASFAAGAAGPGPRGAVPEYLRQRKQQLQDEKDRVAKAIEDEKTRAQYPPGHRPLAEEERQAILSKLATRKKELEADLGRLPLRFDTIAVKNRRQEIMGEMNEVDEAVQKFSVKKQLFVPI